jgi:hypothetical protein
MTRSFNCLKFYLICLACERNYFRNIRRCGGGGGRRIANSKERFVLLRYCHSYTCHTPWHGCSLGACRDHILLSSPLLTRLTSSIIHSCGSQSADSVGKIMDSQHWSSTIPLGLVHHPSSPLQNAAGAMPCVLSRCRASRVELCFVESPQHVAAVGTQIIKSVSTTARPVPSGCSEGHMRERFDNYNNFC